jgi:serine-type D-Ala-D-Ala carboxypeptidase/endopeptidase (penicillin-binding protein 4)
MLKRFLPLALLSLTVPLLAAAPPTPVVQAPNLQQQVEALLGQAPKGTRFGMMVADDTGRVLVSVNPDMRFMPASNTKLFTTAAALALLPGMDRPDRDGGTQVYLVPKIAGKGRDVVLYGRGDARMSSAADCRIDCLATLADAVAAKTRVVGDVMGDDSYFPDQRWSAGMSWNNLGDYNATAASALSLDANELTVRVSPRLMGERAAFDAPRYPNISDQTLTVAAGLPTTLALEHTLNSRDYRLFGQIPADSSGWSARIAIDDPAHYTAFVFADMLRARGVKVTGKIDVRHLPVEIADQQGPLAGVYHAVQGSWGPPLASLVPPPLVETIALTNKPSQNQHAELLLRRIGRLEGSGAARDGLAAERSLLIGAGVPALGFDLYDGSGMSTYNRVSPRAMLALLRWGMTQSWGQTWLASFPVAGRDGTLKRRFIGTALDGKLMAKTGTLNATNALSGTLVTATGCRLTFAFFANDVPDGASAVPVMEQTLLAVAAAN